MLGEHMLRVPCAYGLPPESVLRSSSLQAKTGLFAGTFRGPLFGSSRLEGLKILLGFGPCGFDSHPRHLEFKPVLASWLISLCRP